ncbi:PhzF family phenazine biosynthesis isomerase [Ktedonosporobacter rubrisoli]|uniref:PhzF family phenazine biosynthesis isomerase n=1 Tax=Ktedonosporobacter rubrisoli TaxID=2509675 RepID=A0A4P6JY35_KTERU|nr:PhzF family phenazine biosynthesis isomerase [Ktedonosporobacter rubrisoli]QBD80372.1 PhzF family phenazine biosynthesis isomerase [Ktedonosporobacter rubrisoli]
MRRYRLYQVDAFTQQKFRGNPAGVVPDAQGLDVVQMQAIAREMNCSETAFIFPSQGPGYDIVLRYFTPTAEVPGCGHATIAAHYIRAKELGLVVGTRVRTLTRSGILPVEITWEHGDYKILLIQGRPEFGRLLQEDERRTLLRALGLRYEETLLENYPVQIVSLGQARILLGIRSRSTLNRLAPDIETLHNLSKRLGCHGCFVFTFDPEVSEILTWGRMFAPAMGISEDPVSGNAHGPLGAYLVRHRLVPVEGDGFHFTGYQGEVLRRWGQVDVFVYHPAGVLDWVQVGGHAVTVFQAEITL